MVGTPASSPAFRIRQGESIAVQAWSNQGTTLWGSFRVLYDDGTEDDLSIDRFASTNNRLSTIGMCKAVAAANGWIVQGVVCASSGIANPSTQRGQTFVRALLLHSRDAGFEGGAANASTCRAMLCQGYIYGGVDVALGEMEIPGPAGGKGAIIRTSTANPAASAEIANQQTPVGSIQRLISVSVQLVQGLTQTPLPTLRIQTSGPITIVQIPITATAIGASSTCQLTWAIGLVQTSFTAVVGDEFHAAPLPDELLLMGGDLWNTVTDGIGANTDYGSALFVVEEWVVPN